jgi:vacuolar-type H+-ATPase subunit I/STV1
MSDSGSIGSKVVSELAGIVKDTGKQLIDVVVPTAQKPVGEQGTGEKGSSGNDPAVIQQQQKKRADEQRRFNEVKQELENYILNKKRQEKQEEQVKEEQKKMEEIQKKESQKKQRENSLIGRLSRQYGGTGEIGKGKY